MGIALKRGLSSTVSYLATTYLNNTLLKGIGTMLKLQVVPDQGTMKIEVLLKGESEPLEVTVGEYECLNREEGGELVLRNIETSRQWINALLKGFYPEGVTIPLGAPAFSLVKGVI